VGKRQVLWGGWVGQSARTDVGRGTYEDEEEELGYTGDWSGECERAYVQYVRGEDT
jgi:hypothetical protein